MEKVSSLQVIWEKQVQAAVKIHLYPRGQLLPKPERQWVLARTFRGNPVFCFLTVNVLLLSLFSPLKVLYSRCLQTLMNRSLIFLSKSSILHLTIEYLFVPGSNKRFLALILLPDENGVTTGNTWISQQYSMSIIQKWTHFSPSTLSISFMSQSSMMAGHLKAIHSFCTPLFHAFGSERITDHPAQYLFNVPT